MSSAHNEEIRTICVAQSGALDGEAFQCWLEDLLWERRNEEGGPDILRAKGLLYTQGCDRRRVLQAVREVYEITDGPRKDDGEEEMNKVVLIGRNLDEASLANGLKSCVAKTQ
jgi:G3E family GTPase